MSTVNVRIDDEFGAVYERDSAEIVSSTRILGKGGPIPPNTHHDLRAAGDNKRGESWNQTLRTAHASLTGAMYESEGYGAGEFAYGTVFGGLRLDGGQELNLPLNAPLAQGFHRGDPDVCDGVRIRGRANVIHNVWGERLKGYVVRVSDASQIPNEATGTINIVDQVWANRTFGGVYVDTPDAEIRDVQAWYLRDHGIWARKGNTRITGAHIYGVGFGPLYTDFITAGGSLTSSAIALGVDGSSGPMQMDFSDASDSPIGCYVITPGCKITNCFSQGCYWGFLVRNTSTLISNTNLHVNKYDSGSELGNFTGTPGSVPLLVGVDFNSFAMGSSYNNGYILIQRAKAIGIRITSRGVGVENVELKGSNAAGGQTGLQINNSLITGETFHIKWASGFGGGSPDPEHNWTVSGQTLLARSVAVDVINWGTDNKLYITGDTFTGLNESGTYPTTAGNMLRITAAMNHADKRNQIFLNGRQLTVGQGYAPT